MTSRSSTGARPLIGITTGTEIGGAWTENSLPHEKDYTWRDYSAGVAAAGGLPVLLPCVAGGSAEPDGGDAALVAETIARLDGLILTGGRDVDPRHYGEPPHARLGAIDPARDALELAAVAAARARRLPILGICRGIQVLAVAFGGSLVQDLGSEVAGAIRHEQRLDKRRPSHEVSVEPGSRLAAILGRSGALRVNSYHHQAVRRVPDGFRVSATAPDGVIEAMEAVDPRYGFVVGVQWHPEGLWRGDDASRRLFRALVAEAAADAAAEAAGRSVPTLLSKQEGLP
ncbi:MAG TPA: gamma-glutamyl-gamma-aminobutyrate hydrolase family protein [Thermodesulfobacteriota bacterium]